MILLQLFFTYLQIGLFSFGGGYAAMPLIQSLIVQKNGWLTMEEFADITTIAEMTPGPIAVNSATFVGQKMAGLSGAIACTLGCITPSMLIVLCLAYIYMRYKKLDVVQRILYRLRPAIVAMIASAGFTILRIALLKESNTIRPIECILFVASLYALRKYKVSPILILVSTACIGTLLYIWI